MLEVTYFRKLHDIQICVRARLSLKVIIHRKKTPRKQKKTPATTQKLPNKFRDYKKGSLAKQNL